MSEKIVWTKEYQVTFDAKFPKLFISKHDSNHYCGGVLYYEIITREPNTKTLEMKLESFSAEREEIVFEKCKTWINSNMGVNYTIKELDAK